MANFCAKAKRQQQQGFICAKAKRQQQQLRQGEIDLHALSFCHR
ncbi:hypothetical protein [Lysinibacillus sphaericus]|nr:hypothetical protein [Lysinibacillus sphaericus]